MEKYDIFICYRGDSAASCELGSSIYNEMDLDVNSTSRYNVFFAPKCIEKGANFKNIIPQIMKSVSIVIILFDNNFFDNYLMEDDIVTYELQEAMKNKKVIFLPILLNGFKMMSVDFKKYLFTDDEVSRIKHINAIVYSGIYDFKVKNDLFPVIDNIFNGGQQISKMVKRGKERYYGANDDKEIEFLSLQRDMMHKFDGEVYDRILAGKIDINILDVGCNNGGQIMSHFADDQRVSHIIGIDKDGESVDAASISYPDSVFGCFDVEDANFSTAFKEFIKSNGALKFDLINVSMLLLHLERPSNLLRILRNYLKPDGVLYIRDIDDGMNLAYPDPNGDFARMIEICSYCDMLGYRHSGRQIFSHLKSAGYSKVKLEKVGLDTSQMTYDEKCALFDIYFGYIPTALEKTIERFPMLPKAKQDYEWFDTVRENVFDAFHDNRFLFSLGYMVFTAGC